jgi:hypothetical protein
LLDFCSPEDRALALLSSWLVDELFGTEFQLPEPLEADFEEEPELGWYWFQPPLESFE